MRESATATIEHAAPASRGRLRLVPVDMATSWPHMAEALERVRERGAIWPVEWVRQRIESSNAAPFRIVSHGEHVAYLVVVRVESFDVCLDAWILTAAPGAIGYENREEVISLLDQLARNVGANRWRCEGREGWARVLGERASRTYTVYERDIA